MDRLNRIKLRICKGFTSRRRAGSVSAPVLTARTAMITNAVRQRQIAGMTTSLRQLHKAANLSQPEALSILGYLERSGMAVINHNLSDAFESTVTLTPKGLSEVTRQQNDTRDSPTA